MENKVTLESPINLFDYFTTKAKRPKQAKYDFKIMCINKCNKLGIPYIVNVTRKVSELWISEENKNLILNEKIDKQGHNYGKRKRYSKWDNITFTEHKMSLKELLEKNGIPEETFYARIRYGWSFSSASTIPKYGYCDWSSKRSNKRDKAKFMRQCKKKKYK